MSNSNLTTEIEVQGPPCFQVLSIPVESIISDWLNPNDKTPHAIFFWIVLSGNHGSLPDTGLNYNLASYRQFSDKESGKTVLIFKPTVNKDMTPIQVINSADLDLDGLVLSCMYISVEELNSFIGSVSGKYDLYNAIFTPSSPLGTFRIDYTMSLEPKEKMTQQIETVKYDSVPELHKHPFVKSSNGDLVVYLNPCPPADIDADNTTIEVE